MNKEQIFSHFAAIIDNMLDNSLFFETYFQRPFQLENIYGSAEDDAVPMGINMFFGVSRGCIVDESFPYVVKFDIEQDRYGDSLCERECDIYRAAKANNLDAYFTEPIYLGYYRRTIQFYDIDKIESNMNWCDYMPNDFDEEFMCHEDDFGDILSITITIPLYAYPRVNNYKYAMLSDEEAAEIQKEASSINSPLRKRHMQIAMEFVYRYGMEQYEKLSEFMKDYHINDLHYGNLGELNKNLVCLDYAGWWDSCELSPEDYFTERN